MIDIGILGLDTSHAESFAETISARDDVTLSGVWDNGDVRDATYARDFCADYGAVQFDEPASMIGEIDAAMVLTVDWDMHTPLATEFLANDVPTLIDKPIAGNTGDLSEIEATGTAVFGGSAVPYHECFEQLPQNGTDRTLYAAGYNDYFYYHVHLIDTIRMLAGANWQRVSEGPEPGTTVDIDFKNGTYATLRFDGSSEASTFSVLDIGKTTETVEIESTPETLRNMYESYIQTFLAVVKGGRDVTDRVLDSARLTLAVEAAIENDGPIVPGCERLDRFEIRSEDFIDEYSPYY